MRIDRVQTNQLSFGTTVHISPNAARLIQLSGAGRKAIKDINSLEKNGRNDVLTLAHTYRKDVNGRADFEITASLLDKRGNELFVSLAQPSEKIVQRMPDGSHKFVGIKRLYNKARESLNSVVISKNSYKKFLPYI